MRRVSTELERSGPRLGDALAGQDRYRSLLATQLLN